MKLVAHNAVSLDGRLTGFDVDMATYYRLAGTWREDATLCGSGTILAAPEGRGREPAGSDWTPAPGDRRPLLVIADSRGRVRCWQALRRAGFWRDVIALCSERTPRRQLYYLRAGRIGFVVAGQQRVDLAVALRALKREFGIATVRSDSGAELNRSLLAAGLVTELSLLVHPVVVGAGVPLVAPAGEPVLSRFTLRRAERVGRGLLWLRYRASRTRA
jgi:2,5-diamino-6-(ribosylamino)-4(3H)-pyrimidinone 5'-phosphate reductase